MGRMLRNLIDEADTCRKASQLRQVLWDAAQEVLGSEEIERIAEAVPAFPDVGGCDYH